MMRAPEFWYIKNGRASAPLLRAVLAPFSYFYGRATAKRIADTKPYDPGIPVISVGNATVGGAGKTPIVRYLLASLNRMNLSAHGISRGYGGSEKGPIRISNKHTYKQVGDEPLLLAKHAPVWVAVGRDDAAKAALGQGAKILVMDDAHQNPLVKKTLSILVVDAKDGFGNERIFPAGPLREKIADALSRADIIILMKPSSDFQPDKELLQKLKPKPVIYATLKPQKKPPEGKLLAFAGIGRPAKFFDGLRRAGADLVDEIGFANHKPYSAEDLKNLLDMAKEEGAKLITTEKDYVRLPEGFAKHVIAYPVSAMFEDELSLRRILHPIIEQAKKL